MLRQYCASRSARVDREGSVPARGGSGRGRSPAPAPHTRAHVSETAHARGARGQRERAARQDKGGG
eukprot:3245131-Rhodomonas_salina.1